MNRKEMFQQKEATGNSRTPELHSKNTGFFSERVLDASNNSISFFVPIFDKDQNVIDFKIEYVNNRLVKLLKKSPEKIIGRQLSEFYSDSFNNGDFNTLKSCYRDGKDVEILKHFTISKLGFWLALRLAKLNEGILIFAKDVTKEKEYEEELSLRMRMSNRVEILANMGSYKYNTDNGELICSDNLYRLFGYERTDFKMTFEKYLSFVHPEDRDEVKNYAMKQIKDKKRLDNTYRIIDKDDNIKTFHGTGIFYEKQDNLIMVGAVHDISDEIRTEFNLRVRNQELARSNSELESFNRVASHDLQEPLRKIQMFISRISEEDSEKMSQRSLTFLDKINSSAERMRELIQNLLSYSRVGKKQEPFKKVNLNKVFNNVLNDFSERIKEAKATVTVQKLPSINGIEFQLEQLLGNLLSNALKYRKKDRAPIIEISSQVITNDNLDSKPSLSRSSYAVLKFEDNGIGFEKEYEEKIFDMFHRLHSKNEFSGTGLGLAICQRIVQNHHGYIEAFGYPDKGSTFIIYLPYST